MVSYHNMVSPQNGDTQGRPPPSDAPALTLTLTLTLNLTPTQTDGKYYFASWGKIVTF